MFSSLLAAIRNTIIPSKNVNLQVINTGFRLLAPFAGLVGTQAAANCLAPTASNISMCANTHQAGRHETCTTMHMCMYKTKFYVFSCFTSKQSKACARQIIPRQHCSYNRSMFQCLTAYKQLEFPAHNQTPPRHLRMLYSIHATATVQASSWSVRHEYCRQRQSVVKDHNSPQTPATCTSDRGYLSQLAAVHAHCCILTQQIGIHYSVHFTSTCRRIHPDC